METGTKTGMQFRAGKGSGVSGPKQGLGLERDLGRTRERDIDLGLVRDLEREQDSQHERDLEQVPDRVLGLGLGRVWFRLLGPVLERVSVSGTGSGSGSGTGGPGERQPCGMVASPTATTLETATVMVT